MGILDLTVSQFDRAQLGDRVLHAVRLLSDLEGVKVRRSDVRRTKVGRGSQKSELCPSYGP